MTRVKKGKNAIKNRRTVLSMAKGFRHGRKSKERLAIEAIKHAGKHSFNDRRKKKSDFRGLWITRLNAALRLEGESYSKFFGKVSKKGIKLNRKTLSEIALDHPDSFKRVVAEVNK
ncbi:50S ribosomal protein L20 [Candidatus Nomurabacteria bacterium]|nr:50S ribosomal protein L20 [Candidatus Nomurabacteria bacterium]